MLARERGFAITSILVLGLGIGVNNMMFTLIYGTTMRGLPIPERDRVLHVSTVDQRFPDRPLTYPEFSELRDQAAVIRGARRLFHRAGGGQRRRARCRSVRRDLSHSPTRCRWCAPRRCSAARSRTPTIGRAPIRWRFSAPRPGARATPATRRCSAERSSSTAGQPRSSVSCPTLRASRATAEIWLPLSRMPGLDRQSTQTRQLRVFGRVAPGVAAADAQAEIETLFAAIVSRNPSGDRPNARVVPINERFFFPPTQPTWLAFSTAGILIALVCCANAANLMLATAGRRSREIAYERHSAPAGSGSSARYWSRVSSSPAPAARSP